MLEYKSFLNHTDPIEIKSDFFLTNSQWRERERERERERFLYQLYTSFVYRPCCLSFSVE